MVMGQDSCYKVLRSNPVYRVDIFHKCICCKICNVFEKTKINKKWPGLPHSVSSVRACRTIPIRKLIYKRAYDSFILGNLVEIHFEKSDK